MGLNLSRMVTIHQTRLFTAGLRSASKGVECPESRLLFACRILHKQAFVCNSLSCKRTLCNSLNFLAFKKLKTGIPAFLPPVKGVDFQRILI
jgi:hypothetical protein